LSRGTGARVGASSVRARSPQRPAFVPVRVVSTRRPRSQALRGSPIAWDGELEIALESGRLVRVRGQVDAEWLRQVMILVAATRC
jgi:hypothetical protein